MAGIKIRSDRKFESKSLPPIHGGDLTQGGVDNAEEEASMACSPELGMDCSREVLLSEMPRDRKK
jgi:hypothetical protein